MWIMIAGPYRTGAKTEEERKRNLREMNRVAYEIFRKGHVPVIGVNLALPIIEAAGEQVYNDVMMPISLAAAKRCDGILRIDGESHGADLEVEQVVAHGGVVFKNLDAIPNAEIEKIA